MKNFAWTPFLKNLDPNIRIGEPAHERKIKKVESELGNHLPESLVELWTECGEVGAPPGYDVWGPDRIIEENLSYRNDPTFKDWHMPFDVLLLFGGDGTGSCFGFSVIGKNTGDSVFYWFHENDNRAFYALDLKTFFIKRYRNQD